ncbi:hypothetical protein [Rhodoblastus sp.]|uniref:hypothetical protein n=1 Tax=Rhodoblastus sp. TaxID=1962975 RepID=UPI003F9D9711
MTASNPSQPMALADMRCPDVTAVMAACRCGREARVDESNLPGDVAAPALADRFRCSACGARSQFVRPGMGRRQLLRPFVIFAKAMLWPVALSLFSGQHFLDDSMIVGGFFSFSARRIFRMAVSQ